MYSSVVRFKCYHDDKIWILFSSYFENISTVLTVQSFKTKFERTVQLFRLQVSNSASRHYSVQKWPGHWLESWVELVGKEWRRVSTQEKKRGYFVMHLDRCQGSQDSFLRFGKIACMPGQRCVVHDCSKESINELKIFIHSSPWRGGVYFKGKSFVRMHREKTLLFALCILRPNVSVKHFMKKVQRNIWNHAQFKPSGRKH